MTKYEVQTQMINTWENCWQMYNPNVPATYATLDLAVDAIRDHICDCINAVEGGDMEDSPDPSEFRIVCDDGREYEWNGNDWENTEVTRAIEQRAREEGL